MKRLELISDIEMGGLKMLDIQSMICAKRERNYWKITQIVGKQS